MEVSLASCNAPLEPCKRRTPVAGVVGELGMTISDDDGLISSKSWIGQSLRREVSVMAQPYQQVNWINIGSLEAPS